MFIFLNPKLIDDRQLFKLKQCIKFRFLLYVFIGTDVMEYIVAVDDFVTQIRACSVKLYVSEVETLKGEVK